MYNYEKHCSKNWPYDIFRNVILCFKYALTNVNNERKKAMTIPRTLIRSIDMCRTVSKWLRIKSKRVYNKPDNDIWQLPGDLYLEKGA